MPYSHFNLYKGAPQATRPHVVLSKTGPQCLLKTQIYNHEVIARKLTLISNFQQCMGHQLLDR